MPGRRFCTRAVRCAQIEDLLDRITVIEVHGRDALDLLGSLEPLGHRVDHVNLRCAAQLCAQGTQQSDRAGAEDRHAVARAHVRLDRCLVAGGKDIGEEHEVVLEIVARCARQLEAVEVGIGHAYELGLAATVSAHPAVAVATRVAVRVCREARIRISALAVEAVAAGDVERQHYTVAGLDRANG